MKRCDTGGMDQQPSPYYPAPEGPPPVAPRRVPRVAIAVGLTTLFGLAGAGLAFAAGGGGGATGASLSASSSTSTPTNQSPSIKGPKGKTVRPGLRFGRSFGGPGGFGGQVVHAEYTVKDGSGYKTYAEQVGQVVTVSGSLITVKSDDGFTQTYAVETSTIVDSQSGGISAVAGKDTVRIEALVSGSTQTATNIIDTTKIGASRKGFGYPAPPAGFQGRGPGGPDDPGPVTQAPGSPA